MLFFFNDTATTEIYTLSLHDALPICLPPADALHALRQRAEGGCVEEDAEGHLRAEDLADAGRRARRSEEHTSELQSRQYLVCRLLLEKKKNTRHSNNSHTFFYISFTL